jgi:hypothetical protein
MCLNCQKLGHSVDRCWAEGGGAEGISPKRMELESKGWKAGGRINKSVQTVRDQKPSPTHQTYTTHSDEDALCTHKISEYQHIPFIIDSGASSHMTNDSSHLSSFHTLDPLTQIWVADNRFIKASSIGNIVGKVHLDGRDQLITFRNIYMHRNSEIPYCQPQNFVKWG